MRARGQMLPPYDTRATLDADGGARCAPRACACHCAGRFFPRSRRGGPARRSMSARCCWRCAQAAEWIWIAGNHDPAPPSWLGGQIDRRRSPSVGCFPSRAVALHARGEIAGHLHPCTTVTRRGRTLRRRCFVSDGTRLVMPAFGAYAGGLDVRDRAVAACSRKFPRLCAGRRARLCGGGGVRFISSFHHASADLLSRNSAARRL